MLTYTAEQKKQLVKAFTAAKEFLWDGHGPDEDDDYDEFICIAMKMARRRDIISDSDFFLAKSLIEQRLAPDTTVTLYLCSKNYITNDGATPEIQAYRLAWLNALIAEFSA